MMSLSRFANFASGSTITCASVGYDYDLIVASGYPVQVECALTVG